MPNTIFANMQTNVTPILYPKKREDALDSLQMQRQHVNAYRYFGIVKSQDATSNDKYIVDLYENGLIGDDNEDKDPSRTGISCFVTFAHDYLEVGDWVYISLLQDGTGLIVKERPKVLAIVGVQGPSHEDNYTDERYWMYFAYIYNADDVNTTNLQAKIFSSSSAFYKVVTAVNVVEENKTKGHQLENGQLCILDFEYDLGTPPLKRWLINQAIVPITVQVGHAIPPVDGVGGGGFYNGQIITKMPVGPISLTSNAQIPRDDEVIGPDNGIVLQNAYEVGLFSPQLHWIPYGEIVQGWFLRIANDNRPVYRIWYNRELFWINITGNASYSSSGGPYKYAWTEQEEQLSGGVTTLHDLSGGRSGTTSVNPALNANEHASSAPVPNNTKILCWIGYDDQTPNNLVYRFQYNGIPPGVIFEVLLSAGSVTIPPSYTYNVTDISGNTIGVADMTPEFRIGWQNLTAAAKGTGYYDATGTFVLRTADEKFQTTVACVNEDDDS